MDPPPTLTFREIDPETHRDVCVRFRADSFVASFGSAERFFAEAGPGAADYLAGLRAKNEQLPGSCVHAWLDERIVGQIELRRDRVDPSCAHVLLYYVIPELRGTGAAAELDAYVARFAHHAGFQRARLRVSPTNGRAIAFYRKRGWRDLGTDPTQPEVRLMERDGVR